jgi:site-specific recombinase XerD
MGTSYRLRIGLREIAAMQPNTILWDLEVRGFCARRQFSDVITFSVVYRTKENVQRWQKLARYPILTPHLARQEAIKVLRAKALGHDPAGDRMALRTGMTVAQLCDEYSARENGKKPATIRSDNSRIKLHIKPKLGELRVASITHEQIEDFMLSLSQGSQARAIGLLGTMFTWAIKRKLRSDNPVRGIEKPTDVKKTRRLSEAEYSQLYKAINNMENSTVADIFTMITITGWRSSEVRLLKLSECDLERQIATLGDTKTGISMRPLCATAIEIIKRQKENGSQYVFNHGYGKLISNLRYDWLKLGMAKDVTPHVLRHSYASLSADMGFSDNIIAGMLGHSRSSVTSRYVHLERALIEAADKVAQETIKLMCARSAMALS